MRRLFTTVFLLLIASPVNAYEVQQQIGVTAHELLYKRAFNAQGTSGNPAWAAGIRGDDQPRIQLTTDGSLRFGAGGTSNVDIMLKRQSATQLALRNITDTGYADLACGNLTVTTINGGPYPPSSSLTVPVSIANGGTALTTVGSTGTVPISTGTGLAYGFVGQPNLTNSAVVFGGTGGSSSKRSIPRSGSLQGEYWMVGDYSTDGIITCDRCRFHVVGNVTIAHNITGTREMKGGQGGIGTFGVGSPGGGLGGGAGGTCGYTGAATTINGGGGGGHYGTGGRAGVSGGTGSAGGGGAYSIEHFLPGSGGGGGFGRTTSGGSGGDGGAALSIEATGNITITSSATIDLSGAAGAVDGGGANDSAGGGGAGGTFEARCGGNFLNDAGSTINLNGGNGGVAAGTGDGGGGSAGICFVRAAGTATNSGTISQTGGTAGGAQATAGANGTPDIQGGVNYSIRTAP